VGDMPAIGDTMQVMQQSISHVLVPAWIQPVDAVLSSAAYADDVQAINVKVHVVHMEVGQLFAGIFAYIEALAASAARGASPQNHVYVRFMFVFFII
jgi:hypothetical protein